MRMNNESRELCCDKALFLYTNISFFTIITGDTDLLRIAFHILRRVIIAPPFLIT